MNTIVLDDQAVHIPAWVTDLAAFRRWVRSDEFPEKQRICYLKGEVWVDLSKEPFFSHNQVKGEFTIVGREEGTGTLHAGRRFGEQACLSPFRIPDRFRRGGSVQ